MQENTYIYIVKLLVYIDYFYAKSTYQSQREPTKTRLAEAAVKWYTLMLIMKPVIFPVPHFCAPLNQSYV